MKRALGIVIGVAVSVFFFALSMRGTSPEELKAGRAEIAQLLGEDQGLATEAATAGPGLEALYGLFFQLPFFMHLWFLAFLCWLIVGFVGYTWLTKIVDLTRLPNWLFCSPASLLWLVPLTMIPQYFMAPGTFGPDASVGLLPIPSVLGYYAIFFFFGAIYWDLDDQEGALGRWWYITLPVALLVVFPLGLELVSGTFGILALDAGGGSQRLLGNLSQSLFTWLMIFGSIGMFRVLLAHDIRRCVTSRIRPIGCIWLIFPWSSLPSGL